MSLSEKRGGLIAALLERPDIEDLSMRLVARGDARAGNAELVVSAGEAARANGKATWEPDGAATSVSVQLDTAGPGLPQGRIADAVREPIALSARAVVGDQIVTLNELKLKAGTLGVEASARYDRTADRLEGVIAVQRCRAGYAWPVRRRCDVARPAHRDEGRSQRPVDPAAGHDHDHRRRRRHLARRHGQAVAGAWRGHAGGRSRPWR